MGQEQTQTKPNQPRTVAKSDQPDHRATDNPRSTQNPRTAQNNSRDRRPRNEQLPPTASRDDKSGDVERNVDQYVSSMPPSREADYPPNDAMSKIERQQDPQRQQRLREAAARSSADEEESDNPDDLKWTESKRPTQQPVKEPSRPVRSEQPTKSVAQTKTQKQPTKRPTPLVMDDEPTRTDQHEPVVQKASTGSKLSSKESAAQDDIEPVEIKPAPRRDEPRPVKKANAPKTLPTETESDEPTTHQPVKRAPATKTEPVKTESTRPVSKNTEPVDSEPVNHGAAESEEAPVLKNISVSPGQEPVRDPSKDEEVKEVKPTPKSTPHSAVKPEPRHPITSTPPEPKVGVEDAVKQRLKQQQDLVAKDPNNVEEQFRLRMMYLVDGQDDKALAAIPGLDNDLQEIITAQVKSMMSARTGAKRDPATWANKQLESVETLRRLVRAKADLRVPTVAMCTAIEGFGRYTPLEPAEYSAGKTNYILVYIEVDNFSTEKTASAMYRALLSLRYSLMNQAGEEVFNRYDENIEDLARAPRQDFFLTIGPIALPKQLPAGDYTLKVEVEDVIGGKINSNRVRFKVIP